MNSVSIRHPDAESTMDDIKESANVLFKRTSTQGTIYSSIQKQGTLFSVDEGFDGSDDDEMIEEPQDLSYYCFGRRWYYWQKMKHHKDYIERKYKDLKEELLNNTQYSIKEKLDWDITMRKAESYRECARGRSLRANGPLLYQYYNDGDIEYNKVTTKHIAALLFYTNYDKLQGKFSASFRIFDNEENWDLCKDRNREFANWSRLLRESVELFGTNLSDTPKMKLFHGINCELMFDSIICKFCAPTSMTTSRAVAESFSNGFGLILEIKVYDNGVRYFDWYLYIFCTYIYI